MRALRTILMSIGVAILLVGGLFAQSYNPVGPQLDVPISTVTGGDWVQCYSALYSTSTATDLATIQADCNGARIMLACAPTGSNTLTLLSQATTAEVFTDPGDGVTDSHVANGAQWYFNVGGSDTGRDSWGFAAVGDSLNRDNCDTASGTSPEDRLCWHMQGIGGYRCGATEDLNFSRTWTKYVYTTAPGVSTAAPWQLAAFALLLIAGAAAVLLRR